MTDGPLDAAIAERLATWEKEGVARREQRPPRRYYELTPSGRIFAAEAVARYRAIDDVTAPAAAKTR